jgi:hypothetical protein
VSSARPVSTALASYDSMEGIIAIERSAPSRRFAAWPQARLVHAVYPGVLVAGAIALASTWLGQHCTAPAMLFAAGWRPVGLMVAETAWIAGLVLVAAKTIP